MPRWSTGGSARPTRRMEPGYFRRTFAGLLGDIGAGIAAATPTPPVAPAPAPVVSPDALGGPAVGFGGGGTVTAATAPETTDAFAPGFATVQSLAPPVQVIGGGSHSRMKIQNDGPGPCWLSSNANVNTVTGELLRAGDSIVIASAAPLYAIASPAQPATITWRTET